MVNNGVFLEHCSTCPSMDLCFEKAMCMRTYLSNEFDDDDNIAGDDDAIRSVSTELTIHAQYEFVKDKYN